MFILKSQVQMEMKSIQVSQELDEIRSNAKEQLLVALALDRLDDEKFTIRFIDLVG
jgi:hypothetical protein